jgi:hypothetical protein
MYFVDKDSKYATLWGRNQNKSVEERMHNRMGPYSPCGEGSQGSRGKLGRLSGVPKGGSENYQIQCFNVSAPW